MVRRISGNGRLTPPPAPTTTPAPATPRIHDAVPVEAARPKPPLLRPEERLLRLGLDVQLAHALVSAEANTRQPVARAPVSLAALVDDVTRALARLAPDADAATRARAAATAACAYHLEIGNGIGTTAQVLARALAAFIHNDVGVYAASEQDGLVQAAATQVSRGHTNGHDCFFLSVGSITGHSASEVGDALGLYPGGYRGEVRGRWMVGDHVARLGFMHQRLGTAFSDERFGQRRVFPEQVGFFGEGALDATLQAIAGAPHGTRAIVCIVGHYLHAQNVLGEAVLLDSQTLTGETLRIPKNVLEKNRGKFRGVEVTVLSAADKNNVVHTPNIVTVDEKTFLQRCPFAWEPAAA